MKLSVHLVTWNGAKYLPYLFESLQNQTYTDWELVIWENDSSDETRKIFAELLSAPEIVEEEEGITIATQGTWHGISWRYFGSEKNSGFAGGHNELYLRTKSDYFLLLNQDMYLMPDCFEKMVGFLDEHEDVAAVSPRLMRWDFNKIQDTHSKIQNSFSDSIDALGLKVFRNRRVIEKYTQKKWSVIEPKMRMSYRAEQWRGEQALEVFGVSGAFPMFRRSAIDQVAFSLEEFLDSNYHSYKEDVDLAFRLRAAGHKSFVLLDTVAYHDRSGAGPEQMGDRPAMENKKSQSAWVRYHSYKNHLMTLYKNEYWQNLLLDFPWILWYEVKKFVWFFLFDRPVLKGFGEVWKMRFGVRLTKYEVRKRRKISWREMRRWWV